MYLRRWKREALKMRCEAQLWIFFPHCCTSEEILTVNSLSSSLYKFGYSFINLLWKERKVRVFLLSVNTVSWHSDFLWLFSWIEHETSNLKSSILFIRDSYDQEKFFSHQVLFPSCERKVSSYYKATLCNCNKQK